MPAAVILGLLSALGWGFADFGGGLTSRRAPVFGVLLISLFAGTAIAVAAAVALREPQLTAGDLGWSAASAGFGSVGLTSLYVGLSRGRMGVVAPVTGVLVAVIPAVAGILLEGTPDPVVIVGIGLAIASVLVVSRVGGTDDGRPSGLGWGLLAGLTLGGVTVTIAQVGDGLVFGPLVVMRLGEGILVGLFVLGAALVGGRRAAGGSSAWRIPLSLWPVILVIGALDMGATAAYVAATQAGPLAVAGVLSALYPVVTVILAVVILRERVVRAHLVGIVLAAAAIVLITAGSLGLPR
jgi:drug/metabolite transporter (DMT)-like permease